MERWLKLLKAHDTVLHDRRWPISVRLDTCRLLMHKMLELGPLKPLPVAEITSSEAEKTATSSSAQQKAAS